MTFVFSHLKKGVGSEQFVNRTFVSSEPSEWLVLSSKSWSLGSKVAAKFGEDSSYQSSLCVADIVISQDFLCFVSLSSFVFLLQTNTLHKSGFTSLQALSIWLEIPPCTSTYGYIRSIVNHTVVYFIRSGSVPIEGYQKIAKIGIVNQCASPLQPLCIKGYVCQFSTANCQVRMVHTNRTKAALYGIIKNHSQ